MVSTKSFEDALAAYEARDLAAPGEDEFHSRADALEKAHGIGESISIDEACATLRAAAQSRNYRAVPALVAKVRELEAEIVKLRAEMKDKVAPAEGGAKIAEWMRGER